MSEKNRYQVRKGLDQRVETVKDTNSLEEAIYLFNQMWKEKKIFHNMWSVCIWDTKTNHFLFHEGKYWTTILLKWD